MEIIRHIIEDKYTVLYPADSEDRPLVAVNHYSADTDAVVEEYNRINNRRTDGLDRPDNLERVEERIICPDVNLLFIHGLDWEHDMAPWEPPPLRKGDKAFTKGADDYLKLLINEIAPRAREEVNGIPSYTAIAGYSMAGLFAIYSMYKCDAFDRYASISGSMWFPGFTEYVLNHDIMKKPERVYMSLGDKESRSRNPMLKTVQDNTEAIVKHFTDTGIPVIWELNSGNHFTDAPHRLARGISSLTR